MTLKNESHRQLESRKKVKNILSAIQSGILYGITDTHFGWTTHLECAQALIEAGVQLVQYRGKELEIEQQRRELQVLVPWARARGSWVIVNDLVALAIEVGADGVHLGQTDQEPQLVREQVGPDMLIGLSTHKIDQVKAAEQAQVDYIGVGPAYPTQTKPDEPAAGLGFLNEAAKISELPQVAIGGITEDRLAEVIATGQNSVAVISDLLSAPFLAEKVSRLKAILELSV